MVRWNAGLATILLAVVAAGCGTAAPPGGPGEPVWVEPACPRPTGPGSQLPGAGEGQRSPIPDGFVTSWVLRCRSETRDVPGRGQVSYRITERADTDAAALVEQLRRPSDPRSNGACPLVLVLPPYFLLVDASGRALLPAVPTDGCNRPRDEALKPLETLPFRAISETEVGTVQSQKSTDSGCSDSFKDLVALERDRARPAPAHHLWTYPVNSVRVCGYDRISGGELPVGQLATGRTLTPEAAKPLLDALDRVGPATDCTAGHTRIAVVHSQSESAVAELDGCRRLLRPDHTLGQLDDPTLALLTG
jgi:hypothetical protein